MMARHLLQRFLLTLPALWLVLTLVFLMIHIVPGDPVEQMLGRRRGARRNCAVAARAGAGSAAAYAVRTLSEGTGARRPRAIV